jgi:hypothetical protein
MYDPECSFEAATGLCLRTWDGLSVNGDRSVLSMEIREAAAKALILITDVLVNVVHGYLVCAEWASTHTENPDTPEEDVVEFDSVHERFSQEALVLAITECTSFVAKAGPTLLDHLYPDSVGHDFWLTRNHHGAGFWDRDELDADDRGKKLTHIAQSFGGKDLVLGDDGMTYIE